ncbi:MAG: S-layer homology domain-containing protein [Clostridia bacterium]|nr:S-layer homology domain-containing protein [Clostridia bacterium]
MKKLVGIMLTLVLLLTTAYAEVTMTEAGEIAKTKLGISSEYEDFSVELWDDDTYNFTWGKEDGHIGVTVSKEGDILSYRKSEDKPYDDTPSLYKFTDEELESRALDFIKKVHDKIWQEFVFEKIEAYPFSDDVWVSFKRFKDGIEFCGDYVTVYLDKETGEVTSMETALTSGEPEKADKILTREEAREIFAKNGNFRLEHVFGERGEYSTVVYKPVKTIRYIDATTGEEVELYYEARPLYTANSSAEESLLMKDEMAGGLTDAELEEINKVEGLMTKADAEKIMKNMKNTDLKNYEVASSRINTYSLEGVKKYELYLSLRTKDKKGYGSIRFNAETKELLAFNTYSDSKDEKVEHTDKKRSIAEKFVAEYYNDAEKLEDITIEETEGTGYTPYTYCVKELGALYTGRGISLQIDKNGIIRNYYVTDRNEGDKFSDASRVFPVDDAVKVYYENIDFELKYIQVFDENKEAKIVLAYVVTDEPSFIEGISLMPLEHNLKEFKKTEEEPDYIGHYAEKEIDSLVRNGVLRIEDGKFEPDKALTWEKAVEILNSATPKYVEIPKGKENEEINRLEAVKILIDSLGHKEVAELKGIFKPVFSDMKDSADEGYTALAKGLGIVNGDGKGNFKPFDKTTNADFAIMVYNYLKK